MHVIDHEPSGWFLVLDEHRLLLDVNVSHSFISYNFLMELNHQESAAYASDGHEFISELAKAIQYSAPGMRGSNSPYSHRNIAGETQTKVNDVTIGLLKAGRDES